MAQLNATQYLVGVLELAIIAGLTYDSARRTRRALLPNWSGAPRVMAEAVLSLGLLLAVLHVLGSFGAFRLYPVMGALAVLEVVVVILTKYVFSTRALTSSVPPRQPSPRFMAPMAAAAVVWAFGTWVGPFDSVFRHGITDIDSVQYHLPFAARFFQTGWITQIHQVRPDPEPGFFPADGELLHGVGMLIFRRDVLSPFINFGWLSLLLLAGWCTGRPRGAASTGLVSAALMGSFPVMAYWHAGTGLTDIALLAVLMSMIALLLNSGGQVGGVAVAAVAAGVGLGIKLTIAPAVLAVTIWLLARRATRTRPVLVTWIGVLVVTGSYWFARNWYRSGSPMPSVRINLGFFTFPAFPNDPELKHEGFTILHYATNVHFWAHDVPSGLERGFGSGWPLVIALAVVGVLFGLARDRGLELVVPIAALLSLLGYVTLPYSAGGPPNNPTLFAYDLRYLAPALVLGIATFATSSMSDEVRALATAAICLALVAAVLSGGAWVTVSLPYRLLILVVGLAIAGVGYLVPRYSAFRTRAHITQRHLQGAQLKYLSLGFVVVVALLGFAFQRSYLASRYRPLPPPLTAATRWFDSIRNARIGITGFTSQYLLYGPTLSNRVDFVGVTEPHGGWAVPNTCSQWRTAVAAGGFRYIVIANLVNNVATFTWYHWTMTDPSARLVLGTRSVAVFQLSDSSRFVASTAGC